MIVDSFYGVSPLGVDAKQLKIGGQLLSEQGVQRYIEDYKEFIPREKVLSRIRAFLKANAAKEVLDDDFVMLSEGETPEKRDVLYVGNALFIAMMCKEYEVAAKVAKKGVDLKNGKYVEVWEKAGGCFRMGDVVTENIMVRILQKDDIPEKVWYALWENYAVSVYKRSRERYVPEADLKTLQKWIDNLSHLKEKNPELWKKAATEELRSDLLWCAAGEKKLFSKRNLMQFCKRIKDAELIPEDQQALWGLLVFRYQNRFGEFVWNTEDIERFFRLWKVITGMPIMIAWNSRECNELELPEQLKDYNECDNEFDDRTLDWWLEHIDIISNSETADPEQVISYGLTDETHMIDALKSNLLSKEFLPMAISRVRESGKGLLPLLILKHHGGFEYNWEDA